MMTSNSRILLQSMSRKPGYLPEPSPFDVLCRSVAAGAVALVAATATARAAAISVPNGSFELPSTAFVDTRVDLWTKSVQPAWFDPATAGIGWNQLSGVFANTAASSPSHIDNVDANQALYVFALPTVGLSQELTSPEGKFQVGFAYDLTVGIVGGGGGMPAGTSFVLNLYYRDAANLAVPIASTVVTYSPANFPTTTHLVDYSVNLPAVQAGQAWADKAIGVELASISGTGAGYWDLDNVRLDSVALVPEPTTIILGGLGLGTILLARHLGPRRS